MRRTASSSSTTRTVSVPRGTARSAAPEPPRRRGAGCGGGGGGHGGPRARAGPAAPSRRGLRGEDDRKRRPLPGLALHGDVAAALLHDAIGGREPEARALANFLRREERLEEVGVHL